MKKFCLLTIVLFTSVYSFADVSSVANNAENQCKNLIFNKMYKGTMSSSDLNSLDNKISKEFASEGIKNNAFCSSGIFNICLRIRPQPSGPNGQYSKQDHNIINGCAIARNVCIKNHGKACY